MMQFSGKATYNTEPSPQNRARPNHEALHDNSWEVSSPGQQLPHQTIAVSQSSRTSPSHKPPQQTFLIWVAFTRSFAPNIHQIERRSCPLIGCEKCFDSLEEMLEHVKECPRLSKGLYRCFESGKEERIGRCETPRCQELQQCKDRIVNSLKRRLSPRGTYPRRRPGLPLEMQSLSPEMTEYPGGVAELPGEVPPPDYTEGYFGSVHGTYAELDSDLTTISYLPVELDSGLDYEALMQSQRAELPSEDQNYQYGVSELGADTSFSYGGDYRAEGNYQAVAYQQPTDNYQFSHPNSQEGSNGWYPSIPTPDRAVSQDNYDDFEGLLGKFDTDTSAAPYHVNKPGHPPPSYERSTDYYVPSMGRRSTGSTSFDNSVFSAVSKLSSGDTSMSSWGPSKAAIPTPTGTDSPFLDDANRMCLEPDDIEPLETFSTEQRDEVLNGAGGWDNQLAADAHLKGFSPVSPFYTPGAMLREGAHDPFQISRKPVPRPTPGTGFQPPVFCPEIKYSPRSQPSASSSSSGPPRPSVRAADECTHCGRAIPDKSNLKRHEWTCKKNPVRGDKRHTCRFPGCGKRYTRSDALRVHQNNKGHQGFIDIVF